MERQMRENLIPIEWIGLRLPSTNPMVNYKRVTRRLSKRDLEDLDKTDTLIAPLVRIDGANSFSLGARDGLSRAYKWCPANGYVEQMTPSDARILFRRMLEADQFRRLDDPRDANRKPNYPTPTYIAALQANRYGTLQRADGRQARAVGRMIRVARGDLSLKVIGQRIMKYEPPR